MDSPGRPEHSQPDYNSWMSRKTLGKESLNIPHEVYEACLVGALLGNLRLMVGVAALNLGFLESTKMVGEGCRHQPQH